MRDFTDPKRDKLVYKWLMGDQTDLGDFGSPFESTSYALCLYTEGMSGQELSLDQNAPAHSRCGRWLSTCWDVIGSFPDPKGIKYRDSYRNPDGIQKLVLKPGAAGAAKITLSSGGALLPSLPTLPVGLPITVQLHHTGGECWTSTFTSADVKQQPGDPAMLKGVARR